MEGVFNKVTFASALGNISSSDFTVLCLLVTIVNIVYLLEFQKTLCGAFSATNKVHWFTLSK